MPKALDITGQKFGKLTAIKRGPSKNNKTYWYCQCDCGNPELKLVQTTHLTRGLIKSCGCIPKFGNKEYTNELRKCLICGKEFRPNVATRLYCFDCVPIGLDGGEAQKRKKRVIKQFLVDYKGGKCERCGYDKSLAALQFHHLDPSQKDFELAHINLNSSIYTMDEIKKELDKCILLCANCHAEEHSRYDDDIKKITESSFSSKVE